MVHVSSAAYRDRATRPAALGWALGVSACLHLLLLWPAPVMGPQHAPVASTIKAELRLPAQVAAHPPPPGRPTDLPTAESSKPLLDSGAAPPVPGHAGVKPPPRARRADEDAAPASREVQAEAALPSPIVGDALTRYRLGLAAALGRDATLDDLGSPARPVTVELVVILGYGRAVGVEIADDGGFAMLAARAAERTRRACRVVSVPPELGGSALKVSLALRFEP